MKIWEMENELDVGYKMLVSADKLSFDRLDDFDGRILKENWVPLELKFLKEDDCGTYYKKCDAPDLMTGVMVFNQKAVDVLKYMMGESVEILPVNVEDADDKYYAINVIDVGDYLDYEKCEFRYYKDGTIMRIEKFAFKTELIKNKHIFKISLYPGIYIFISDEFRNAIRKARLKGFEFTEMWDSEKE